VLKAFGIKNSTATSSSTELTTFFPTEQKFYHGHKMKNQQAGRIALAPTYSY